MQLGKVASQIQPHATHTNTLQLSHCASEACALILFLLHSKSKENISYCYFNYTQNLICIHEYKQKKKQFKASELCSQMSLSKGRRK